MIRRSFRIGLTLGVLGLAVYAVAKALARTPLLAADGASSPSEPGPRLSPPEPWVPPDGGVCPISHPVKAKLASRIFHLPGMLHYERLHPDRCYTDAAAAAADGLRVAKR